ncbi:hypothetical protein A3I95_02290 [Candidatus Nomurabacteria bacterium RIFCSPLOWO2_02_FULL_44_12]|uniref:Plasmid stabilization protein n=1 Tax=Candidatus Nomurabacteria bacterium RIFCSPLOWO2_12_FULL_44_11 TaxID=1801796 RepID=A0A1F6Y4K0_9BACT|nr:MAG: hypothetical protein A3G53_00625 [Candidatus Nomurabacteria bacterium RIFCSPLOWO2_12_FULL_44_11]OGJ06964.1 MAG: hypothetical protein A3I95_02290 [Candidatus Nomurabacteria bacterium RIFCSPLOWO2_02_FULL_44_12]
MILLKTNRYKRITATLPVKARKILVEQEILLIENIFHPKLHTKKLKIPGIPVFSFRITRNYRGIFRIDGEYVILSAIGHRKDIYQSLE